MNQDEQWLLEEKYGGEKSEGFLTDRARLAAGEPLAYIIGFIPFLDCAIWLDSKPLIPRPETEFWVKEAIGVMRAREAGAVSLHPLRVLDLAAGSGCIGVAIAKHTPDAYLTFAELDPTHLPTIQKNIAANTPVDQNADKHTITQSDLFSNLSGKFDFILSNPPYIDPALDRTELSVKNYEPHLALYGGADGLVLIERLIATAGRHLTLRGQLWIEHEPEQSADIQALAETANFIVTTHKDQYQVDRYSILTMA